MKAWEERRAFHDLLADDAEVTAVLDDKALAACFDLGRTRSATSTGCSRCSVASDPPKQESLHE